MNRFIIVLSGCILLPTLAIAEPVKLTTEQCLNAAAALMQLDGWEKAIKDGDKEKTVKVPYKISGVIRMAIAKDLLKLNEVSKTYNEARQGLFTQFSTGGKIEPGTDAEKQFTTQLKELLAKEETLDLTKLKIMDILIDDNQLPPTTIALLDPLLEYK